MFNFHEDYKMYRIWMILVLAIVVVTYVLQNFIPWLVYSYLSVMETEEFVSGFITNIFWCGSAIYIVSCCVVVIVIRSRLCILNLILKRKIKKSTILIVSLLHLQLCQLVVRNLKVFSFQLASVICMNIFNTTLGLFELYEMLKYNENDSLRMFFVASTIMLNIFYTILIILIITAASLTMNEGEKTLTILHEGIFKEIEVHDGKLMKRFQIFLLQLEHFNVNITCGFFIFDWKVFMMVNLLLIF